MVNAHQMMLVQDHIQADSTAMRPGAQSCCFFCFCVFPSPDFGLLLRALEAAPDFAAAGAEAACNGGEGADGCSDSARAAGSDNG